MNHPSLPGPAWAEGHDPRTARREDVVAARILHRAGGRTRATFDLRAGEAIIGREPGLAVLVPAPGVSRQHARLTWDGTSYWIEDLESHNGTFVNGLAVLAGSRERLRHMDVITLGQRAELLFLGRAEPATVVNRVGIVRVTLRPVEPDWPTWTVAPGTWTVGRSAANELVVDHPAVSKVHARLQRTADYLVLQDLCSSNGTYLNGQPTTMALLEENNLLSIGGAVVYTVEIERGDLAVVSEAAPPSPSGGEEEAAPSPASDDTRCDWDPEQATFMERSRPDKKLDTALLSVELPPRIARVRLTGDMITFAATKPGVYEIGRAAGAALRLQHPAVSRVQGYLTLAADRSSARLQHVGTALTFLNGQILEGSAELRHGDHLELAGVPLEVGVDHTPGGDA